MKQLYRFCAFLVAIALFSSPIYASYQASTRISPYVDISLNTHWSSQYHDNEPPDLIAISQKTGLKSYHLAFINDFGHCKPSWAQDPDMLVGKRWAKHLTDALRANGIQYLISFGGSIGNDISKACSPTDLLSIYEQVIQTYRPQGLDFDIENGTADIPKIMAAVKKIQLNHPNLLISFTLIVMPFGLESQEQDILEQAKAAGITFSLNIMTMSFSKELTGDMGKYSISALTHTFNYLQDLYPEKSASDIWSMLEATPMIGVNDISVEQFGLEDVDTLRNFAIQNAMGGLAFWSMGRDQPCSDTRPRLNCSGADMQTKPFEFTERFLGVQSKTRAPSSAPFSYSSQRNWPQ